MYTQSPRLYHPCITVEARFLIVNRYGRRIACICAEPCERSLKTQIPCPPIIYTTSLEEFPFVDANQGKEIPSSGELPVSVLHSAFLKKTVPALSPFTTQQERILIPYLCEGCGDRSASLGKEAACYCSISAEEKGILRLLKPAALLKTAQVTPSSRLAEGLE